MTKHIKLLGALYLVFGGMGLCAALILLAITFLGSGAAAFDDPKAGMILGTIGMVAVVVASIVTLPNLLAGWGLLRLKPWARILTLVLSFFNLPAFPIGTAIGVYGIWVLFQAESLRLFESGPQADLVPGGQQPAG
jgi:hypothetical protein